MNDSFFELIRVAIGNKVCLSRVPSAKDWCALYGLSVKQALTGVCFCGVQRLANEQREKMPRGADDAVVCSGRADKAEECAYEPKVCRDAKAVVGGWI